MRKVLIKKCILFYTIIYILIFITLYFMLKYFNLTYRSWFVIASVVLTMLGLTIGTLQLIQQKKIKIIVAILFGIIIVLIAPYSFLYMIFNYYCPENIIIHNNKKYVAYTVETNDSYVSDTKILYYEYRNFILRGNKIIFEEYYENSFLLDKKLVGVKYYDEDGKVIKEYKYNYTTEVLELVESIDS